MAPPIDDAGDGNDGERGGKKRNRLLCGAPFPPRPKAIATFISSSDFLPGCQTLLHSVKAHLAPTPEGRYPPEIVLLQSSKVTVSASNKDFLHPLFCDRIVRVQHIPIAKAKGEKPSHVESWDENCGWTKLRLFEMDGYDTILYIDSDCLVVKDVGHLLDIDQSTKLPHGEKVTGLLAAAPDIFPPDKFNAGVMVLRPSRAVFREMMSRLPGHNAKRGGPKGTCESYDGGDTGFLNSFYPGWYRGDMPSYSRLPFGCNAQRFMHHCTHEKQPKYWDDAIDDLRIIHYSSSPKPWEKEEGESSGDAEDGEKKEGESSGDAKDGQSFLDVRDAGSVRAVARRGELERTWLAAYERSNVYYVKELEKRASAGERGAPRRTATRKPAPKAKPQSAHRRVQTRYKELRKTGVGTKEAMTAARAECGLDEADAEADPSKAVGKMFGLM